MASWLTELRGSETDTFGHGPVKSFLLLPIWYVQNPFPFIVFIGHDTKVTLHMDAYHFTAPCPSISARQYHSVYIEWRIQVDGHEMV